MSLPIEITKEAPAAPALKAGLLTLGKDRTWLEMVVMALAFLALWPVLGQHRVTDFIIFCILVLSFDLLYGYMGRLSFGHILYYGTGGYICSVFIAYIAPNPLLGMAAGIFVAMMVAMLVGLIVSRADGAPFSLTNLAFNQIGLFCALSAFADWTKGDNGLPSTNMQPVLFLDFLEKPVNFWFSLFWLLVVFYLLKRLTRSPFGVLIRSIKEDESRVRFVGYSTFYYKWLTYVISCTLASLAGVLITLNYTFISPHAMDPNANLDIIFASLLGGAGNLYGAVVGGILFQLIKNYLPIWVSDWEAFLGIALLILVFNFRKGLTGFVMERWAARGQSAMQPEGGEAI